MTNRDITSGLIIDQLVAVIDYYTMLNIDEVYTCTCY